jgi:hypothetical protein
LVSFYLRTVGGYGVMRESVEEKASLKRRMRIMIRSTLPRKVSILVTRTDVDSLLWDDESYPLIGLNA